MLIREVERGGAKSAFCRFFKYRYHKYSFVTLPTKVIDEFNYSHRCSVELVICHGGRRCFKKPVRNDPILEALFFYSDFSG